MRFLTKPLLTLVLALFVVSTSIYYFSSTDLQNPQTTVDELETKSAQFEKREEENKTENVRERALQEFEKTKDPTTGTVPKERLLEAKKVIKGLRNARSPIPNIAWTERGPNNVGGRTRAIFFDKRDATNNTVFAAGITGGLWKTTNFKAATPTWTMVDDFFQNMAISAMVQNPTNPMIMYFGTGEGYDGDNRGLGIWNTTDGGTTWMQLPSTNNVQFHFVQDLLIDKNGHLYASTGGATTGGNGGIKKSVDGGNTWNNVLGTIGADLELAQDGSIYASIGFQNTGVEGTVWKSNFNTHAGNTGNQSTWTNITPAGHGKFERIEIALAPSDANRIYLLCEGENSNDVTKMFRSEVGGSNWISLNVPTICDQGDNAPFTRVQAWYDLIAVVHPTIPDHLYIGGIDALRSFDKGATWTQITDWANNVSACNLANQPQNVHADHHMYVF